MEGSWVGGKREANLNLTAPRPQFFPRPASTWCHLQPGGLGTCDPCSDKQNDQEAWFSANMAKKSDPKHFT